MDSMKAKSLPNPRDKANVLSVLFWSWTIPLFKKGYSKVLTVEDLYDSLKTDKSTLLGDRLEKQWEKQLKQAKKKKTQPNLLKTMFLTFHLEIVLMGLFHMMLEFAFRLFGPIMLGRLLQYFKPQTTSTFEDALIYAGALSLASFLTIMSANHLMFLAYHIGGKIRIAVCSLVYRKALKLSKTALGETAPGKIVNLVANDVNRFDLVMIFLHTMWTAPLVTCIIAYILYTEIRYAALIGIAVIMTVVPIQVYTGKLSSVYRLKTAIKTDERVRLMDEIISGVQVIKMYAWEKPFCVLVEYSRRLELKVIKKSSFIRGIFMTFIIFTTRIAVYCTLISMLMFGESLSADKIFVLASFYNILSNSISAMFVRGFAEIAECKVSVKRIQSFLMLDEFREDNVTNIKNNQDFIDKKKDLMIEEMEEANKFIDSVSEGEHAIAEFERKLNNTIEGSWVVEMDHVTAKWSPELIDNTIENINLKLEKGKLYAVIGIVGSGKSSFLSAILGEINLENGNIRTKGNISYVDQETWVFGSSIRQNILFGQEFDKQRYQNVIKACSLSKDFAQFPQGDRTIVGERGSSLSGGQKARINLARAVYRQADIYLLDDPLSAVDAHVGKHLFEDCIRRYLRGKTRILATHQLQYVKDVDGIILLNQGKMQYYNNYHRLLEAYPEYNCLIAEEKEPTSNEDISTDKIELRKRFSSIGSQSRISENGDLEIEEINNDARNIEDVIEQSSKGVVKGSVFLKYFQAGSSLFIVFIVCILFIATQAAASINDCLVPYIVTVEESRRYYNSMKNDISLLNSTIVLSEDHLYPTEYYLYFYTGVILSIFVLGLTRAFIYYVMCLRSNESLHNSAFSAVIRSSMRFFDTNPSGRILNRFSKDTTAIDEHLPKAILDATQALLLIAGALIVTCSVNPIFLVPGTIVGVVSYGIRHIYLKTSKNIKRLEGMTRSPVFTHLNATLNGISTIRAYQAQEILKKEFDKFQDLHTSSWYMYTATSMAYAFFLDLFCFIFITFITFSFLFFKDEFSGGQVGLAITQMMAITNMVQWGMRQSAEVTNQMMSVERILEYTQLPPENNIRDQENACKRKKKKKKQSSILSLVEPPKDWPNNGTIEFINVFMRYTDEDSSALNDLCFLIHPSEKVGIVGRTGAGKSSLIATLFRLAKIDGSIKIDGIDTGTIPVEDLRSRISIIPQDPVLFSGTLRRNLDPFEEFPDTALWEALEEVELKEAINASGFGLNYRVLDRGSNFSVGQRQLVCLARAVLRNNKVLMLDEATANVDPQTDALIQQTIRTKFATCTVLTVAHRLNTIIDSDKVIVMDRGHLVEFDHPYILLQNENSSFTSLVKETGDAMFKQLYLIAKQCYENKYENSR